MIADHNKLIRHDRKYLWSRASGWGPLKEKLVRLVCGQETICLFHITVHQQWAASNSLPVQAEDLPALNQDELHDLVLVNHVDRHVASILLRPHEGGAEDDAEALG